MAHPEGGSSSTVPRSNWNLEMLVFEKRVKPEYPEKTSRNKDESQQRPQTTYDSGHWDSDLHRVQVSR